MNMRSRWSGLAARVRRAWRWLWWGEAALIALCAGLPLPAIGADLTNACTGLPAGTPVFVYLDFDTKGDVVCAGATKVTVRWALKGVVGTRYCRKTDGSYAPQWAAATWAQIGSTPGLGQALQDGATVLATGTEAEFAAFLNAKMKAYASKPLADPELAAVWCPYWQEIWNGIPAPQPVTSAYIVAKAGALTTRNTFFNVAGKRGAINGVANVGDPCGEPLVVEWPLTYGTVTGGSLTLCTKRTP